MPDELLLKAQEAKNKLFTDMQTITLSTLSKNNEPNSSYAPSFVDNDGNFFIYISSLSKHTLNLIDNPELSAMIIEDESKAENIFARKRFTISAEASIIDRDSDIWINIMAKMESKFGETMTFLKDMTDFHLFKIVPNEGLLVHGFARAFRFNGEKLSQVNYLNEKGHTQKK